jgi:hypothetical protein
MSESKCRIKKINGMRWWCEGRKKGGRKVQSIKLEMDFVGIYRDGNREGGGE